MNQLTVAQTFLCALALVQTLAAADDAQLLAEFQRTQPGVSEVHVIQEQPLLVAVTGNQGDRAPTTWSPGELLGVFARLGNRVVPIAIQPAEQFRASVWVELQEPDSITLALADDYGIHAENIKIFYDPKTYFPKRIVRFAPVRVRHISVAAGVVTLTGGDGKEDFTVRERNGVWRVTASPAASAVAVPAPIASVAPVTPMPVSTLGEFEKARPDKARHSSAAGAVDINEEIGPYQRVGGRIWVGKTFYDGEGNVGVGDLGYFDQAAQDWTFLHLPQMADWAASALLVETDAVWAGLVRKGEGAPESGGLLRYDLATRKVTTIALPDVIDKIIRVGKQIYCGTSGGFAIVDQNEVRRLAFIPQLDGSYVVTPVS